MSENESSPNNLMNTALQLTEAVIDSTGTISKEEVAASEAQAENLLIKDEINKSILELTNRLKEEKFIELVFI